MSQTLGIMDKNRYIRFDWAVKRMLRDKANFDVLEGLLNVLLPDKVKIVEILESEGNQNSDDDKFNRVDIMTRDDKGEYIIVEVQQSREIHYLERILYGVSKVITDNMHIGDSYGKVKKVYSINIVYFPLGSGKDYLYHGTTDFIGVHTNDRLDVTQYESDTLKMRVPKDVFPEYYIIRVNEFNSVAKTPLEEWIDYLKTGNIREDTQTPGLKEAREKLQYMMMDEKERRSYESHMSNQVIQEDVLDAAHKEGMAAGLAEGLAKGLAKGHAEGLAKGMAEGRAEGMAAGRAEGMAAGRAEGMAEGIEQGKLDSTLTIARKMLSSGMSVEVIAQLTDLSIDTIKGLL